MNLQTNRREFLCAATAAALSAAVAGKADAAPADAKGEWRNRQSGMAYRRLGRTGYMISEVVMGGNTISPANYDHVLMALDMGLNYLDTAPAYGGTRSEEGYGHVLKARPRDSFFLNSKVSSWDLNRGASYKTIYDSLPESEQKKLDTQVKETIEASGVLEPDYIGDYFPGQRTEIQAATLANLIAQKYRKDAAIRRELKQTILTSADSSLKRLGTDHLDLLMTPHGASTAWEVENNHEIFEAFETLKKAGKVRALGVSSHTAPGHVLKAAIKTGVYSAAMVASSIVNHPFMKEALAEAKQKDFGVICMKVARPVHNGRNNGTIDDPRRVKLIQDAVPGPLKVPQKAYAWMLRHPAVSAVISEMANAGHVKDNLALAAPKSKAA